MPKANINRDRDFYRSLLQLLTDDFPWLVLDEVSELEDATKRAAEGPPSIGELQLTHLYTDAELYVRLPDHRNGNAAHLVLDHPLDRDIPSTDGGFIGALGQSHATIAQVYQSEYIEPVEDPNVILHGCVPKSYNEQKVYSMMTAIDAIVLRIQRLHEDVQSPIYSVISLDSASANNHSPDTDNCAPSES